MRIVVVGAGGVGGYFGARLARSGADVTFVARGAHLAAIRERGLTVTSTVDSEREYTVPAAATDDLRGHGPVDAVLFCVKSFDTDAADGVARSHRGVDALLVVDAVLQRHDGGLRPDDRSAR